MEQLDYPATLCTTRLCRPHGPTCPNCGRVFIAPTEVIEMESNELHQYNPAPSVFDTLEVGEIIRHRGYYFRVCSILPDTNRIVVSNVSAAAALKDVSVHHD